MPPVPVPERTPCGTLAEWNQHLKDAMLIIDQPETEENWDRMERAFLILASVVRGGAYKLDADFVPGVRTIARSSTNAMLSDRSRLSGPAVELLTVIGARMGIKFEPLIPLYIPTILKLCTRSSKIYVNRAQNCLKLFAAYCRVPPLVTLLKDSITDKSATLRFAATDALHDLLSTSVRDGLPRRGKWVEDVEIMIKITTRDASPETRKMSRRAFTSYCQLWPERVADFVGPLSPTTRRYLDMNDSAKAELSRQPSQMITFSNTHCSPKLSRARSATNLALRPTPIAVASHMRTASEQAVPSAEPTRPLLRTVRSTTFRKGATSSSKPAARPPSRERPQVPIEPLVYETSRPRSAASYHQQERPPSSRSVKEPQAGPVVAEALSAAKPGPAPVTVASAIATNTQPAAHANAPPIRERRYPFAAPGFVPKSRREREAEAARIPLPPSPTSAQRNLPEVSVPLTTELVEEPPVRKEPTPPPPSVSLLRDTEPATSEEPSAVPHAKDKKSAVSLVNKLQPSFRPRRGGTKVDVSTNSRTQSQAQARKPSAFGAPAIITTVQPIAAPSVHAAPVVATGAVTKGVSKGKPMLPAMTQSRAGSKSAASSVSSRSVSAHASGQVAADPAVDFNNGDGASHSSKPAAGLRGRVVSNPAAKASKSTSAQKTDQSFPSVANKPEPRTRNATGMTLSQLLKQKPPVHKKAFVPTSKLRSAKSNANLKGAIPSAQKPHHASVGRESSNSNVEPEVAARVALPPSPKGRTANLPPAEAPLPPSPVAAAAQSDMSAGLVHEEPLHPSFPTIESIKERLSEVLGSQSLSSNTATTHSAQPYEGVAIAPTSCTPTPLVTESEPELTLDDLQIPRCPPDTIVGTPAVSAIEDISAGNDLEVAAIASFDVLHGEELVVPGSHPSLHAETPAEKPLRELEARTVLGEVGVNMDL